MTKPRNTESKPQPAEVVREYGPYPGMNDIGGVTFDGSQVWFAGGEKLAALDPQSGDLVRELAVVADSGTAFDGEFLWQLTDDRIQKVDPASGKAYNREPDMCWECFCCIKACPQSAIGMRGYSDVMPLGASLTARRNSDSIGWTVKYRHGAIKHFEFAIRTTPWGSIQPFRHSAAPQHPSLRSQELYGQAQFLGIAQLPVIPR